jgi:two-component system, chemotaxis family, protein-glutamate methylesterase/glutaminase
MSTLLVVDDSAVMRKLLRESLSAIEDCAIQTASNGAVALSLIRQSLPDLVVLDIEMTELDGLETLRRIRATHLSVPVIMFSSLTEQGAAATIESLMLGATDYATKPTNDRGVEGAVEAIRTQLLPKVQALLGSSRAAATVTPASLRQSPDGARPVAPRRPLEIVAIGSSTGGPNALADVIPQLAREIPVPVVVVQHMPPVFTKFLAERLNSLSAVEVHEARGGERLVPGHVWIAPGDFHMLVKRNGAEVSLEIQQTEQENSCRPSVDVLFRSVGAAYPGAALGVVLTGMGQDGLMGARMLAASGSAILAQDEASSVVWGMPGYVAKAGIADKVLPLSQLADEINSRTAVRSCLAPLRKGASLIS